MDARNQEPEGGFALWEFWLFASARLCCLRSMGGGAVFISTLALTQVTMMHQPPQSQQPLRP